MQRIAGLDSRSIFDYLADQSADTPPAKDPGLSELLTSVNMTA